MKNILMLIFVFLFSGCATSFGIKQPDGDSISCQNNFAKCVRRCDTVIRGVVAFTEKPLNPELCVKPTLELS